MRSTLLTLSLALAATLAVAQAPSQPAQTVLGNWRTSAGSVLTVGPCKNSLCIRLVQVEASAPGTVDRNNPDPALRSRSLCNLEIGSSFQPNADRTAAEDGQLYDPESGKTYTGALKLDGPTRLKLRGYIGVKLFGRTEIWTRDTAPLAPCHH